MLCHGQGDIDTDPFVGGCCFVNGDICSNRWYIEPAGTVAASNVYDSNRTLVGTVDAVARSFVGNSPTRRQRVFDAVQGTRYICKAAVYAIDADPTILNSRAAFESAWQARAEYTPVGNAWVAGGKPFNWCMTYGPAESQCCHSETSQENATKAGALTTTTVAIRRAAPGAS